MRAAGIISAADAEGSVRSESSDDDNTSAVAPRRRLTRAEYDAGHGDSDDFDDASDDEAQSPNLADCAPPSLRGLRSRGEERVCAPDKHDTEGASFHTIVPN